MGADVNHPAPGDSLRPSFCSVIASMDSRACRYSASLRAQGPRVEIISDLEAMTVELFKVFHLTSKLTRRHSINNPKRSPSVSYSSATVFPKVNSPMSSKQKSKQFVLPAKLSKRVIVPTSPSSSSQNVIMHASFPSIVVMPTVLEIVQQVQLSILLLFILNFTISFCFLILVCRGLLVQRIIPSWLMRINFV